MNTFGVLRYHQVQVQMVDVFVCEPGLRVKIKEGTELRNTAVEFLSSIHSKRSNF